MSKTVITPWKPGPWSYVVAYLFGSMLGAVAAEVVSATPAQAEAGEQPAAQGVVRASATPQTAELASFLHTDTVKVQVAR